MKTVVKNNRTNACVKEIDEERKELCEQNTWILIPGIIKRSETETKCIAHKKFKLSQLKIIYIIMNKYKIYKIQSSF